ncbi:hypothetical protein XELAEV_18007257mg [Xenopus laevis]|uniref:Olfactory receptor n=1 Tax=Xenopus laevis TaxID=8355 RepID=A0A974I4U2_XENLA|nr:hypothetical protein XELAEV_18007257mg [Xenopus laevis]
MEDGNETTITEFFLRGFPTRLEIQILLFIVFLIAYIITISENIMIIMVIQLHSKLRKPMFFFLSNMSFLEICYISVTLPNLLVNTLSKDMSISLAGCMAQLYFFISLMCTECVLLAVMAFDRYIAVCHPLHYVTIISNKLCIHLFYKVYLSFCGPNIINHFFCDISPVLNLACVDMSLAEFVDFVLALVILLTPLFVTVASYLCIIFTILKIPTNTGRQKAFSTCASHLTVVTLFFSTTLFMYARPKKAKSLDYFKILSLLYAVFTPMLNPFIYCLRNNEIWGTLKKYFCCKKTLP